MKRRIIPLIGIVASLFLSSCGKTAVDNSVEVTFSWNFQTTVENPEPIRVVPGGTYGTLPENIIDRDGYTFKGWNLRKDGKGDTITSESIVDSEAIDHILYANWVGNQYKVSFDLHGGNINGATSIPDAYVTCGNIYGAMVIPNNPQKKLGTFLGWYLNEEGTGEEITISSKVTLTHDHTLHAVFKDVKLDYVFDTEDDLADFTSLYDALTLSIDNGLIIRNESDDPRQYMAFHSNLRAGSVVNIDAEFVGTADPTNNVRAGMYMYGLNEDNRPIEGGYRGDPGVANTREEVKNWYYGQGANNVQAWELAKWNNGHIQMKMNILEDSCGVYFMFDFGRRMINEETHEIDYNPELWIHNKWVINSIHIDYADYEAVKDSYDFTDENDIDSFLHPQNVNYEIDKSDNTLKISQNITNQEDKHCYLEFETQFLPKDSWVDFEVTYYGGDAYSSDNTVGIFTYGNYPNGKMLQGKIGPNGRDAAVEDSDPQQIKDFYWGAYGATNEPWAVCRLYNGQKVSFSNYLVEDSYGITLYLKFGTANGYFKINRIDVHREKAVSYFDFSKESQMKYFYPSNSVALTLDGDKDGDFLKVQKTSNETCFVTLKRLIKKGQTATMKVSYVTDDNDYNSGGQFTCLMHRAKLNKDRNGDPLDLIGNAKWDGGWDGSAYTLTTTFTDDCYGLWIQFVFNHVDNSYFKIMEVEIE